jgi:hypothetical protein
MEMTDTTMAPTPPAPAGLLRHWLWRPPGVLFYLAVGSAVVAATWFSSLQDFGGAVITQLLWGLLAAIWGVRLVGTLLTTGVDRSVAVWTRWLAVPLILGAVFAWTRVEGPFDLRLLLSRAAMDEAAIEIIDGGSTERGWIGLWPVQDVERLPGGMRFIVSGCGFIDRCGFAYLTNGSSGPGASVSEDRYEQLEGNWFMWTKSF